MRLLIKAWDFIRYDVPYGIKNLIFFFPTVWNFRSFDYTFNLRLLLKSLEKLADNIEFTSSEVVESKMKKVSKIRRAIEILNHEVYDQWIELAEKEIGREVNINFEFGKEPEEIIKLNGEIYDLARDMSVKEWSELHLILRGQDHNEYLKLLKNKKVKNHWDKWFDGSGLRGWWN